MQRRDFLTASAATATLVAASAGGHAAAATSSVWSGQPAARVSRARFVAWLNSGFKVAAPGSLRTALATLIEVQDGPVNAGLEQFSVVFRGSSSLPTGQCWLSHEDGSEIPLYLDDAAPGVAPGVALRRATFSLLEQRHG